MKIYGQHDARTIQQLERCVSAEAGAIKARQVRRLIDGRHALFARARDAAGNWGPVRAVVVPVDRAAPMASLERLQAQVAEYRLEP